ncbi:hypothetical protein CBR_g472 [Chara braunii]|uniref:RRM domain-containing protein n=1 Tax=Chara braunii TaxID=69332 RepID=A0A388KB96_CHABU|nr:hypothetical protein CBR_g472 [Chara braunii]|eukprot:GBG67334.1 hypothetical protein CBR_g472 [Chara braunii]
MDKDQGETFSFSIHGAGAVKLRKAVHEKLLEYTGNYADDVLAEYIVVLVAHGKTQAQAVTELEAFLSSKTGAFTAWLWDHVTANKVVYADNGPVKEQSKEREKSREKQKDREKDETDPPLDQRTDSNHQAHSQQGDGHHIKERDRDRDRDREREREWEREREREWEREREREREWEREREKEREWDGEKQEDYQGAGSLEAFSSRHRRFGSIDDSTARDFQVSRPPESLSGREDKRHDSSRRRPKIKRGRELEQAAQTLKFAELEREGGVRGRVRRSGGHSPYPDFWAERSAGGHREQGHGRSESRKYRSPSREGFWHKRESRRDHDEENGFSGRREYLRRPRSSGHQAERDRSQQESDIGSRAERPSPKRLRSVAVVYPDADKEGPGLFPESNGNSSSRERPRLMLGNSLGVAVLRAAAEAAEDVSVTASIKGHIPAVGTMWEQMGSRSRAEDVSVSASIKGDTAVSGTTWEQMGSRSRVEVHDHQEPDPGSTHQRVSGDNGDAWTAPSSGKVRHRRDHGRSSNRTSGEISGGSRKKRVKQRAVEGERAVREWVGGDVEQDQMVSEMDRLNVDWRQRPEPAASQDMTQPECEGARELKKRLAYDSRVDMTLTDGVDIEGRNGWPDSVHYKNAATGTSSQEDAEMAAAGHVVEQDDLHNQVEADAGWTTDDMWGHKNASVWERIKTEEELLPAPDEVKTEQEGSGDDFHVMVSLCEEPRRQQGNDDGDDKDDDDMVEDKAEEMVDGGGRTEEVEVGGVMRWKMVDGGGRREERKDGSGKWRREEVEDGEWRGEEVEDGGWRREEGGNERWWWKMAGGGGGGWKMAEGGGRGWWMAEGGDGGWRREDGGDERWWWKMAEGGGERWWMSEGGGRKRWQWKIVEEEVEDGEWRREEGGDGWWQWKWRREEMVGGSGNGGGRREGMEDAGGRRDVLEIKRKLTQVQQEMINLRARQAQMAKGLLKGSIAPAPVSSKVFRSQTSLEDVDSRTVFVSNVHFGASKEALMNHFRQCGPIANVRIVLDSATGKPKGCAYVEFVSKEAAAQALQLNESTLLSRVIKVVEKSKAVEATPGPITSPVPVPGFQLGRSSLSLNATVPVPAPVVIPCVPFKPAAVFHQVRPPFGRGAAKIVPGPPTSWKWEREKSGGPAASSVKGTVGDGGDTGPSPSNSSLPVSGPPLRPTAPSLFPRCGSSSVGSTTSLGAMRLGVMPGRGMQRSLSYHRGAGQSSESASLSTTPSASAVGRGGEGGGGGEGASEGGMALSEPAGERDDTVAEGATAVVERSEQVVKSSEQDQAEAAGI